ncbi:MAG TPA: DUF805 domain-containing protein, partial [Fimbriiglobus sp.]
MANPRTVPANFFRLSGRMTRGYYLVTGIGLFLLKFTIDWTLATQIWQRPWSMVSYLFWPNRESVTVWNLPPADRDFGLVMLAVALPFICAGVKYTVRRIRDAGLPRALVLLFFIPVVNLLLILFLCIIPSRPVAETPQSEWDRGENPPTAERNRSDTVPPKGVDRLSAFAIACGCSVAVTVGLVYLSANVLKSYGFGVFVAAPFAQGWLAASIYGFSTRRTVGESLYVAAVSLAISGVVLILVAVEGLICILMASPIALALGLLGGLVGYTTQSRPWANDSAPALMIAVLLALPAMIAADSVDGQ